MPSRLRKNGNCEHEEHFGSLSERLLARCVGDSDLSEKLVRVLVVERERNADQDRRNKEHQEVSVAQQRERLRSDCLAIEARPSPAAPIGGVRGSVKLKRPSSTDATEHIRKVFLSIHQQGQRRRVPGESVADDQARDDPSDRAPEADAREIPARVSRPPERDRIHESQRRHVQDHVGEQAGIEIVELLRSIQHVHEHGTDQVNRAQQSLGIDVPVGDQADEEGRDNRAPRLRGVSARALCPRRAEARCEVAAHRDEPAAPDKEFQEHHHA